MREQSRSIPLWLYKELEEWADGNPVPDLQAHVRKVVEQKRTNDANRLFYSASKDPRRSEEDRDTARQIYLDRKGVPESFRYHKQGGIDNGKKTNG